MRRITATIFGLYLVWAAACTHPEPSSRLAAGDTPSGAGEPGGEGLTTPDPSNASGDIAITQRIRQAITANDSLSSLAQNVNIITINGMVTLRGPVSNEHERATVVATAAQIAGKAFVTNRLEIAAHQ